MKHIFAFLLTSSLAFELCAVSVAFRNPELFAAQEQKAQRAKAKQSLKFEFSLAIDQVEKNGVFLSSNPYLTKLIEHRVVQTRALKNLENCSSNFSTYRQLKPFWDFQKTIHEKEMTEREKKFAAWQRADLERANVQRTMYHGSLD